MSLASRWPLDGSAGLRDALLAAYADPSRGYHDTLHLTEVLDRIDELADAGETFERLPVVLAAWFHDSVYDALPDAEERSAQWAETALPAAGFPQCLVDQVALLVRMTEHHRPAPDDPEGCALSDADLAILASGPVRYADYLVAVRQEYSQFSDTDFRAGRDAILEDLLAGDSLFHTKHGHQAWEPAAHANLKSELEAI